MHCGGQCCGFCSQNYTSWGADPLQTSCRLNLPSKDCHAEDCRLHPCELRAAVWSGIWIIYLLHGILSHLEVSESMFLDFSSAFSTIQQSMLRSGDLDKHLTPKTVTCRTPSLLDPKPRVWTPVKQRCWCLTRCYPPKKAFVQTDTEILSLLVFQT